MAVDLGPLRVLVGPNAAGKSNLLAAIRFLGDVAREDLAGAIALHGGYDALLFRGKRSLASIRLKVVADLTEFASATAADEYSLTFRRQGKVIVRREELVFKRTRGPGRRITVSGLRVDMPAESGVAPRSLAQGSAALSTLPKLGDAHGGKQVRELAELFTTFRVFDVDAGLARLPAPMAQANVLDPRGANLAAFLYGLSLRERGVFELLEADLRRVLPGFRNLDFKTVGGPTSAIEVGIVEKGLSGVTPLAFASFGTIRALALLAMLHDPAPPRLTCVEEVDHGLHPHAIDVIVDRMRSASARTQLLVATHSPTFVNRLAAEEIIVCERDETTGASIIPAISSEDIAAMVAESELLPGELWFSGALGGGLP